METENEMSPSIVLNKFFLTRIQMQFQQSLCCNCSFRPYCPLNHSKVIYLRHVHSI